MRVWICGRTTREATHADHAAVVGNSLAGRWELLGVYTSEEKAVARCRIPDRDFVGPAGLDVDFPERLITWPDARYPMVNVSMKDVGEVRVE